MVRRGPRENRGHGEPSEQQASDPERDPGDLDTTAVPGEERQTARTRNEPDIDEDVE
jgi:hypothetical protein